MTEQIMQSKTKSVLLGFFLSKPYRYFSEQELRTQLSGRNLKQDLKYLVDHDYLLEQSRKRMSYFALNRKAFLDEALRTQLMEGAKKFEDMLAKEVMKLRGISFGVFSGMFQGLQHVPSDIVMIGSLTERALDSFQKTAQKIVGQDIAFTAMTLEEYEYRKNIFDRFIKDIFENNHQVIAKSESKRPHRAQSAAKPKTSTQSKMTAKLKKKSAIKKRTR